MGNSISLSGMDGIAMLRMDVPHKPMNVLANDILDELEPAIDAIVADATLRGVVVCSGKDDFMAGADLKSMATVFDRGASLEDLYQEFTRFSRLLRRLETCGKPVVAAVNGTALGGGLELALACHRRIGAQRADAVFGLPEVTVGLLPGAGGTQRLLRMIGIEKALSLLTLGTRLDATQARAQGLLDELVPPQDLLAAARRWLDANPTVQQPWDRPGFRVPGGAGLFDAGIGDLFTAATARVARSTQRNHPAPIAIVSAVYEGAALPIDAALRIESAYFISLLRDPVSRNMSRTLFVNKGTADKLARRPKAVPPSKVERLGVLGAGMMGAGIAYVAARQGMRVTLLDTAQEIAERGKQHTRRLLDEEVSRGRMAQEATAQVLQRIEATTDFERLADCELVIEAVFEDRSTKASVTQRADQVLGGTAIVASNTSTLPIGGLAEAARTPERFIGLHFFSPVDRMALVEVIRGRRTSDETLARALDFVRQLRKTPIVVNDSRGFFTSRVFATYTYEGMAMLEDGVAPALIENAARQAGMAVGPLAVSDEVTLELIYKVDRQTRADLGADYVAPAGIRVLEALHDSLQRRGRRHGAGFYDYPPGEKKRLWPGLAAQFPRAAEQPDVAECKRRLLYVQALDTARCLFEGVLTDPAEADIGSILGWGFPTWTGGALSLIDTVGVQTFTRECEQLARRYGPRFAPPRALRRMAREGRSFHSATGAAAPPVQRVPA